MLTYLDSEQLRNIINGARLNLEINKAYVDSLNVFPVPDGDTGTNMSLTMTSTVKEVEGVSGNDVKDIIKGFSLGALRGARGNSGVILSQIFKGMAEIISSASIINTKVFAKALQNGSNKAYDAVTHPKEGTILTVIRIMGDYAVKVSSRTTDYLEFFEKILKKGNEVLAETPEMLPVLKKAGVVDAGGQGLIYIISGMYNVLAGIEMKPISEPEAKAPTQMTFEADIHDLDNIQFAYCTEFFISNLLSRTTMADIDRLRDKLMKIGDCVIVVGDLSLVKVHVHTNNPDKALGYALALGELDRPKIENMLEQNRQLKKLKDKKDKNKIDKGMVAISCGKGFKELFSELNVNAVLEGGQTMNPSVADIVKIVDSINANTVFVLPNNKNIILACEQAKELTSANLVVIGTLNVPMGVAAAIAFDGEADIETNIRNMQKAAGAITCLQITHAVRNTELNGFDVHIGDIIGLEKDIIAKGQDVVTVTEESIERRMRDDISVITLYYGEDIQSDAVEKLMTRLTEKYPDKDIIPVEGGQPHYYFLISLE